MNECSAGLFEARRNAPAEIAAAAYGWQFSRRAFRNLSGERTVARPKRFEFLTSGFVGWCPCQRFGPS
jgi:hypothetical protein